MVEETKVPAKKKTEQTSSSRARAESGTRSSGLAGELMALQDAAGNSAVSRFLRSGGAGHDFGPVTVSPSRPAAKSLPTTPTRELEQAANRVALEHAAPQDGSSWFAERSGLSVEHAKRSVGSMLGVGLGRVSVRHGGLAGAPLGALARTRAAAVEVDSSAPRPNTPVGQAVLAHELTHVVQQSPDRRLPRGPREVHRDQKREVGRAPAGMAQHTISCDACQREPSRAPATTFSDVKRAFRTTSDEQARKEILEKGIATARNNARRLYNNANKPPVSTLRKQYEKETGIDISYDNPFIGVSQDHVERAYRAWAENPSASRPPWELLAVWVKEGLANEKAQEASKRGIPANSKADARSIYRSLVYYMNLGADVYIKFTAVKGGDNQAVFGPGTGADHDKAFEDQIKRQVKAGRLPRDISGEINSELKVEKLPSGEYKITATDRFYELSLMLMDAFYREQREALAKHSRVKGKPDPGLVYMRWNMRRSSFEEFMKRPANKDPDGTRPSFTEWAFHRKVRQHEYGQPRRNAIRFKYLLEVFRHAYEDRP